MRHLIIGIDLAAPGTRDQGVGVIFEREPASGDVLRVIRYDLLPSASPPRGRPHGRPDT